MRRALRRLAALAVGALAVGAAGWLLPRPAGEGDALPPARHEASDVGFRAMAVAGVLMLLALGAVLGLALWLFPGSTRDDRLQGPLPRFPDPRLQTDTGADMAAFRARQMRQLDGAYWIDRPGGVVHLPIGQAMRDVAEHGIADWPSR